MAVAAALRRMAWQQHSQDTSSGHVTTTYDSFVRCFVEGFLLDTLGAALQNRGQLSCSLCSG